MSQARPGTGSARPWQQRRVALRSFHRLTDTLPRRFAVVARRAAMASPPRPRGLPSDRESVVPRLPPSRPTLEGALARKPVACRACAVSRSAFLASLPDLVVDGGLAIFISPYSWLKQYTPDQSKWLGGHSDAEGKPIDSFTVLRSVMASHGFTLEREGQEPFVIREHRRKFQWGCSHLTVWRKTA